VLANFPRASIWELHVGNKLCLHVDLDWKHDDQNTALSQGLKPLILATCVRYGGISLQAPAQPDVDKVWATNLVYADEAAHHEFGGKVSYERTDTGQEDTASELERNIVFRLILYPTGNSYEYFRVSIFSTHPKAVAGLDLFAGIQPQVMHLV
jgi:hypothetical protein